MLEIEPYIGRDLGQQALRRKPDSFLWLVRLLPGFFSIFHLCSVFASA